jgi:hypothetical protein
VNFHARFTPDGPEPNDAQTFLEFWMQADDRTYKLREKELKTRTLGLKKLQTVVRRSRPIIRAALRDEISADVAARKIKQLVPDRDLAGKLFDHWQNAAAATSETVTRQKDKLARDEADLRRCERLQKANKSINRGLRVLAEGALAGDTDACRDLAGLAVDATRFLYFAERLHPEVVEREARARTVWPVLDSGEAGWEKDAARRVSKLDLGANLQFFRVRFRRARGTDANLPARLWAKAAVRVAEETRWRGLAAAQLVRDFGSAEAIDDFCLEAGWEIGKSPRWKRVVVALDAFSQISLPQWTPAIRQMIREEMPDFHTRPEWANQRRTAARNGRDSVGEIQNAILDDIVSALTRVAPEKRC